MTPVGKIFKPALQQLEISRVIHQEALALGLAEVAVEVVQDARRGLVARIAAGVRQESLAPCWAATVTRSNGSTPSAVIVGTDLRALVPGHRHQSRHAPLLPQVLGE
ncbi:hypothetical protein D9M68_950590 [compost metagenome]